MSLHEMVKEIKSDRKFVPPFVVADPDGLEMAVRWGKEDGLEGKDRRGFVWFAWDSLEHKAYNEGWCEGQEQRRQILVRAKAKGLATVRNEFDRMPADFAEALAEVAEHGIRYVSRGIDWAEVEDSGVGM